ncbi:MAG TPA: glycosyltransferase family 1 protein [Bryobacteraceae bacterium]|nr:glycosyltransferase family 1 protein [Bryobacteraceae bacterium]
MRVALDGAPLDMSTGGLRRYTESLSRALRNCFPDDVFETLVPRGSLWWSVRLPWRLRSVDVFHGTNFEVPYLPVSPAVMTVHDVSPWKYPELQSGAARVRRRCPALIRLGLATMLIVPTRAVAAEVSDMFGVSPARLQVVPEGSSLRRVECAPSEPYFLFAGTIEPRKNVPLLIEAWRPLKTRAQLVVAGRRRSDGPVVPPEPGLHLAGEVSDSRLAELMSCATALVYPSEYEGFGLPVVEGMSCGTPVIASRDAALMEVSAGAALHVEPRELRSAMTVLLDNAELRSSLQEAGLRRAAELTWDRAAQRTREVYVEAIDRHRSFA